ncbi:hypothetical protein VTK73DRAFT_1522 [Phialemonium thermophilum]|uniref:Amidohydrolase-related domain-containing protein n=1 Tax=Phialemonium thermophilum TaxID=223376 RepID=A0ABR3X9Z4_9PEZI
MSPRKGTIAIEEAVLNPEGIAWHSQTAAFFAPPPQQATAAFSGADTGTSATAPPSGGAHALTAALLDIHGERLARMDATGVEYMLLSLTSGGPQAEADPDRAAAMASTANDWLAAEVAKNPSRFGALASLAMHDAHVAAAELRRCVRDLGMLGAIVNDYQDVYEDEARTVVGKAYYDDPKYHPFWAAVEELGVPVYLHPRYPAKADLAPGARYGPSKRQLLGAAVQFHLDLSYHVYALCSSGIFDRYPKVQVVIGHLGEGIPFNLWRADHWYNKPVKKKTRPSKEDYSYYFKHNISITTSGNFSTRGLKFCIEQLGVDRCLYSIDYPYDTIEEAQEWWKTVDLPDDQKEAVARANAIKLFKLPLEL